MVKKCPICNKTLDSLVAYKCKRCDLFYCDKHRLPENHSCSGLPNKGDITDWINEEEKFKDKKPDEELDYKHEKEKKRKREKKHKHERMHNSYGSKIKHSRSSKIKNRWNFYKNKLHMKRHYKTGNSGRTILALFVPLIVGLATLYFLEPGVSLLVQYSNSENALMWLLILLIIPAEANSYVPWIAWIAAGFAGGLISGKVLIPFISMYILSWVLIFILGGETINQSFAMFSGFGMNQVLFQMLAINFFYSIFAFGFGGWIGASIGGR